MSLVITLSSLLMESYKEISRILPVVCIILEGINLKLYALPPYMHITSSLQAHYVIMLHFVCLRSICRLNPGVLFIKLVIGCFYVSLIACFIV